MALQPLNWNQRNYATLNEFLAKAQPGEIAVFDWDNTCIFGDIGEALLRRLTFDLAFAIDARTMAATVPDQINGIGHVRIKGKLLSLKKMKEAVFSAFARLKNGASPDAKAHRDKDYRVFTSGLLALGRALEETPGIGCEFAYPWVNLLLQGLPLSEFDRLALAVIDDELHAPLGRHAVSDPQGRWRYDWVSGIRLYPEMRNLATHWRAGGGIVVVSTASNAQLVKKMIARTGFPCRQVIGMEMTMAGRRFGHATKPGFRPNLGMGKVVNIRQYLAGEPVLVAGDSDNDAEMLRSFPATRLRLIIFRPGGGKIAALARKARAKEPGYLLQDIDRRLGSFTPGFPG